ncbi:MAG: RdgB/HAM1 family non-canonical purine NTP pyrophosphatase [Alphaproteobacteria bacterium]
MTRAPLTSPLVLASHNPGKLREIQALLEPLQIAVVSAAERGVEEPEETGASFAENAALKARHSAKATGLVALADDSGLAVAALSGAPGIYSARWAGPGKDFTIAMKRVEEALRAREVEPNGAEAAFICNLALAWPDGRVEQFEGEIEGRLTFPPRGSQGFGYDPIFVPTGGTLSFGEMNPAAKHRISHRALAFQKLVDWLDEKESSCA